MSAKEIAKEIAEQLMFENEETKRVSDDSLEKDCYLAVSDLKGDIKFETEKILKDNGYVVE